MAVTSLHDLHTTAVDVGGRSTWKPLRFFSLYRLILSGLLFVLAVKGDPPAPLASSDPRLFYGAALAYLGFALVAHVATHRRFPAFPAQVYTQVVADIIALTLLMHASGGIAGGMGMLLVASIAGGSVMTEGRTARLFAALATIALLAEHTYANLYDPLPESHYPHAGMLGIMLFATAVLAHVLARRLRESEALAERRGVDLANMAELAQHVIQQLEMGVLVVDRAGKIRLSNSAAREYLGTVDHEGKTLDAVCPNLARRLHEWPVADPANRTLDLPTSDRQLIPRFQPIGERAPVGTLILLEDAEASARQAQQLKLAAVGRLTAGIAHEIRNPLGAISNAAELLGESSHLDGHDRRLTVIIREQSQRLNRIVENVLQLSRRNRAQTQPIELKPFVERFVDEFQQTHELPAGTVAAVIPHDLVVRFDPTHLYQILSNLCQNGVRHASGAGRPKVRIAAGGRYRHHAPVLEVNDAGPGVSEEVAGQLFEPFVTTEAGGTGLGLYVSRELAECNRARLEYARRPEGACFRLSFAHPAFG